MGDSITSFNYRKRFEEEHKTPAIVKITDGVHNVLKQCPSFAYVEWLEDLLEQQIYKRPIATENAGDVKPVIFCKGKSIISGYKTNIEDVGKIISLMDEIQKFGASATLQYCPGNMMFTILTDAETKEAVFQKIRMFAKGFLETSNITITKER